MFGFKQLPVWKCVRHPTDHPPPFSLFVSDILLIKKTTLFLLSQVQLFEKMVEREDSVPLYSHYMEVNSVSQSARACYTRLTNGIFLNEVMRVM